MTGVTPRFVLHVPDDGTPYVEDTDTGQTASFGFVATAETAARLLNQRPTFRDRLAWS